MHFYVYLNGTSRGPFTEERLRDLLADGSLQPGDLAAAVGENSWKPLGEFRRFTGPHEPAGGGDGIAAPAPRPPIRYDQPTAAPSTVLPPPLPPAGSAEEPRSTPTQEATCFRTSLHWIIFVRYGGLALAAFVFGAIPFAIGVQAVTGMEFGWFALPLPLFILVAPAVAYWSSELVVTERRIRINTGVLRRQTMEMFIEKVESIAVDQGFLGRLWDFGTVTIRGSGGSSEPFEAIAHPIAFRDAVQRLQSGERLPAFQTAS
jgi:membrane protein YdbS with pleckstrin-like domain